MKVKELSSMYERGLTLLSKEIEAYKKAENMWIVQREVNNSAGNLALHLCGNLNHFIGNVLGKTGYVRERELEFSSKNIPQKELLEQIQHMKNEVLTSLNNLTEAQLSAPFPIETPIGEVSTELFVVHLFGHLNYHVGQISYHRRLLDL